MRIEVLEASKAQLAALKDYGKVLWWGMTPTYRISQDALEEAHQDPRLKVVDRFETQHPAHHLVVRTK